MDEKRLSVSSRSESRESNKEELTPEKVRQIVITFIKERIGQELPQGAYFFIDEGLNNTKLFYSLKDYRRYSGENNGDSTLKRFSTALFNAVSFGFVQKFNNEWIVLLRGKNKTSALHELSHLADSIIEILIDANLIEIPQRNDASNLSEERLSKSELRQILSTLGMATSVLGTTAMVLKDVLLGMQTSSEQFLGISAGMLFFALSFFKEARVVFQQETEQRARSASRRVDEFFSE